VGGERQRVMGKREDGMLSMDIGEEVRDGGDGGYGNGEGVERRQGANQDGCCAHS
jgi:hypothetical protein